MTGNFCIPAVSCRTHLQKNVILHILKIIFHQNIFFPRTLLMYIFGWFSKKIKMSYFNTRKSCKCVSYKWKKNAFKCVLQDTARFKGLTGCYFRWFFVFFFQENQAFLVTQDMRALAQQVNLYFPLWFWSEMLDYEGY